MDDVEYVDQVKRKWEYEARHPEVSIQAGRDRVGAIVFTATIGGERFEADELREILDALEDPELLGIIADWGKYYAITYSGHMYHVERRDDGSRVHCKDTEALLREVRENYDAGPVKLPD